MKYQVKFLCTLFIACFFVHPCIKGQDIHFSQYLFSPMNLNPALTGGMDHDFRLTANHRNQWNSITIPYKTYSAAFDAKFAPQFLKKDAIGIGLLFNRDLAGDADFGSTQGFLSLSYMKSLSKKSNAYISVGTSLGFVSGTYSPGNFTFNSQWDGNKYNPDLPSGHIVPSSNEGYFDVSTGAVIYVPFSPKIRLKTGVSLFHINKPSQSFFNNSDIKIDPRLSFHLKNDFHVSQDLVLSPVFLYMNQGEFDETNFGILSTYYTSNKKFPALHAGGWHRYKDAIVIMAGIHYYKLFAGLSFDINTSSIKTASYGYEGMEISLIYVFDKQKPLVPAYKICPVFL